MVTDRLYTGQRAQEELGIYYYNARWYDPYLNRWLQPDTIVPESSDSQSFDRYSYVRNNPANFSDPSGHAYTGCANPDGEGGCEGRDKKTLFQQSLLGRFGLSVSGSMSLADITTIYQAAVEVSNYVDGMNAGTGDSWVRKYMGGTTLEYGSLETDFWFLQSVVPMQPGFLSNIAFPQPVNNYANPFTNIVNLIPGFTEHTVIHELIHVTDNKSRPDGGCCALIQGGGISDKMMYDLSSNPNFMVMFPVRFIGGIPGSVPAWVPDTRYGNHSTADYFAEAFALTIDNPNKVNIPVDATQWVHDFVLVTSYTVP